MLVGSRGQVGLVRPNNFENNGATSPKLIRCFSIVLRTIAHNLQHLSTVLLRSCRLIESPRKIRLAETCFYLLSECFAFQSSLFLPWVPDSLPVTKGTLYRISANFVSHLRSMFISHFSHSFLQTVLHFSLFRISVCFAF